MVAETIGLGVDGALLVLLVLVLRHNFSTQPRFWASTCWPLAVIPILAGLYLWVGIGALAIGLAIFDGAGMVPQLVKTFRCPSLAGLSLTSWGLRIAVAGGWLAYAFSVGYPLLAGWTFVMLPASVAVFGRIMYIRRRAGTTSLTAATLVRGAESGYLPA